MSNNVEFGQQVDAEHLERARKFVREVITPSRSVVVPLEWLKVQAEGLTESWRMGGHRINGQSEWLQQRLLLVALQESGYRIRWCSDGRAEVFCKRRRPYFDPRGKDAGRRGAMR